MRTHKNSTHTMFLHNHFLKQNVQLPAQLAFHSNFKWTLGMYNRVLTFGIPFLIIMLNDFN